jgi:hypothetical protein
MTSAKDTRFPVFTLHLAFLLSFGLLSVHPKSCRALPPAVRAIFVLDGRGWDHQEQDIALGTILAGTRRNREWFSAKWQLVTPVSETNQWAEIDKVALGLGIVRPMRLHDFV